jgi:membrane-bound ClpP family serine protease
MTLPLWAIMLFAIGAVLVLAEVLLPTHGVLAAAAVLAVVGGVVACYRVDFWLGTGAFFGTAILTPLLGALLVKVWPHTPVGRRVTLPPVQNTPPPTTVRVGQAGTTVSELRPTGIVEFEFDRVEAVSEHGLIDPGRRVTVVAVHDGRPTVRAM